MSVRSYDTPPRNPTSLEQRLRNLVGTGALQQRVRRQIGYIVVIASLAHHARDEDGLPLFAIKGGVAVELSIGLAARATKDLDAAVRTSDGEIERHLRDALARGWDGFTFRVASWRPIGTTAAWRGDIKVAYRGRPFSTVQFEAAPAEGDAGRALRYVDNVLVDPAELGLSPVGQVPVVTLAYMVAQKLHACTDHATDGWVNDRVRDLIDVLLVRRLLQDEDLADVRRACIEVFELRDRQPWPPAVTVLEAWPVLYVTELAKAPGFEPDDVHDAACAVDALIDEIDRATG